MKRLDFYGVYRLYPLVLVFCIVERRNNEKKSETESNMKVLKLKSPGKINLRLDILGKKSDGYHELRMLNSMVNIYDELEISSIEKGVEVECDNDPNVPNGEENIVYGAAKEIMAYSNKNIGIKIKITKNIPTAAGMGGGSSNAASVIMALNDMLKINLPEEKLHKIGLRFGADIPFFLFGESAIATGIGENLERVKLPKLPLIIMCPNIAVSTKSVFSRYDGNGKKKNDLEFPDKFPTKKTVVKFIKNDLEEVTPAHVPEIDEIKGLLKEQGALASQMTGSGPAVFGIFPDKEKAEKAYDALVGQATEKEWKIFLAENIA